MASRKKVSRRAPATRRKAKPQPEPEEVEEEEEEEEEEEVEDDEEEEVEEEEEEDDEEEEESPPPKKAKSNGGKRGRQALVEDRRANFHTAAGSAMETILQGMARLGKIHTGKPHTTSEVGGSAYEYTDADLDLMETLISDAGETAFSVLRSRPEPTSQKPTGQKLFRGWKKVSKRSRR